MSLRITKLSEDLPPIEWDGFTPDWARDKSLADIERFHLACGSQKLPVAELFQVRGKPEDDQWELQGDFAGVHGIGSGMSAGCIRIQGPAGRRLGSEMQGGEIHVHGNAGDMAGAEMHGGFVHVHGNAGNLVAASYRGSARGTVGGTILVEGDAGNELGAVMRGGFVVIGGSAGDAIGSKMLGGTVLVLGESGMHPGAGMRRGTIGLFGRSATAPSSFRFACMSRPILLGIMGRNLARRGFETQQPLSSIECEVYGGDFLTQGRGEIWVRRAP